MSFENDSSHLELGSLPGACMVAAVKDGQILAINDRALSLFGCGNKEEFIQLSGGTLFGAMDPGDRKEAAWRLENEEHADSSEPVQLRCRLRQMDGSVKASSLLVWENGEEYDILIMPFLQDSRTEGIDFLTSLPGMRRFFNDAGDILEENRRRQNPASCSIVYFNLTNFHRVNLTCDLATGDALLARTAQILKDSFPGELIARFSADHFVILTERPIGEIRERAAKAHEAEKQVTTMFASGIPMGLRCGICEVPAGYDRDVAMLCDLAKIACDSKAGGEETYIHVYNVDIRSTYEKKAYISEHIDEAVKNGEVRVFYQPVIRSMSLKLCGFEALARWNSPLFGFMNPGEFIPVLEESHQIHKVDLCVLDLICKRIRTELDAGRPVVPISFNLSRVDFVGRDMHALVRACVEKYQIPRELVRIEITESTMMSNRQMLSDQMGRFRRSGFEVWMDDFGSGYSSLNVLKDFQFDEIKIDMEFLRSFTKTSKEIVASTVRMAKKIRIHTLAEGVESAEQVAFLKDIGCEKMQGYYFGKPMPYEEAVRFLMEREIAFEPQSFRSYFDAIGRVDLQTEQPLLLVERVRNSLRTLHFNDQSRKILEDSGHQKAEALQEFWQGDAADRLCEFLKNLPADVTTDNSGPGVPMYLVDNGHYIRIEAKRIARAGKREAFALILTDLSTDEELQQNRNLDASVRSILTLYDGLAVIEPDKDQVSIRSVNGVFLKNPETEKGIHAFFQRQARDRVYLKDKEAFLAFTDFSTLQGRLKKGYTSRIFRTRQLNGEYYLRIHTLYETSGNRIVYAVRDLQLTEREILAQVGGMISTDKDPKVLSNSLLFQSIVTQLDICMFWKDKNRRFLGCSQAFLDYYGLDSVDEILGKTDEEVGWNVDTEEYATDERAVLEEGLCVLESPGKCLIRGKIHDILASKAPVYKDGKIAGLVGYFTDAEIMKDMGQDAHRLGTIDRVTGCLNPRGILETALMAQDKAQLAGERYGVIIVRIPTYASVVRLYGREVSEALLKLVAERILNHAKTFGSLGRTSGADFILFVRQRGDVDMDALAQEIREDLDSITSAGGSELTLRSEVTLLGESTNGEAAGSILLSRMIALVQKGARTASDREEEEKKKEQEKEEETVLTTGKKRST